MCSIKRWRSQSPVPCRARSSDRRRRMTSRMEIRNCGEQRVTVENERTTDVMTRGPMRLRMIGWSVAFVLAASGTAWAAAGNEDEDVTKDPGYVDFGTVDLFGNKEPDVEVIITT